MHQPMLGRLFLVLGNYLAANGLEQLLTSPADISWGTGTLVQPDLFIAGNQAPPLPGTAHSRPIWTRARKGRASRGRGAVEWRRAIIESSRPMATRRTKISTG